MWMQLRAVNIVVKIGIGKAQRFNLFCVVCEHPDSVTVFSHLNFIFHYGNINSHRTM